MSDHIIGIDLGTTNSEVAIVIDGKPVVIPDESGELILPSVVGLSEEGKLLVGQSARNQYVIAPERTVKSVKRSMGKDVRLSMGTSDYTPQEISAMILRSLKQRAERYLGQPVQKAVITVPAFFNDAQRQATREAGSLAGLDVVRIINEPTAAALVYNPDQNKRERFLVYDLGGGTFDVSIVQFEEGVFEVLASHGDTELGGDDFDQLLFDSVVSEFEESFQINLSENRVSRARVLRAVEEAKKKLTDHPFARIEEEFIAEKDGIPLHLNTELDRSDYEELIAPLIQRTMDCVQRALDDAHLTATQIDRVVLVGGSTRTPMISRMLESRLGQPPHREIHPELCVAMGAAIQGAIIAQQHVETVLVDITPHTLGIKTLDQPDDFFGSMNEFKFTPIIKRNSPLPAVRSEVFCTVVDRQPRVDVEIFQGESEDVRRNHHVGKFTIDGLAKVPAGNQLVVELNMNLDGVLKVTAREKATGLMKQITIQNVMARFAVEERDAAQSRLNRLWSIDPAFALDRNYNENESSDLGHSPKLDPGPLEGQRETVQAKALLEKAERIIDRAIEEDKVELRRLTEEVRTALTDRRWGDLTQASNNLSDVLFYLEDA